MSEYEIFELAIAAELTTITDATIVVMPESKDEYKIAETKALIFVGYSHSSFDDISNMDGASQNEIMKFEIHINSRKRRGNIGVYEMISQVKKKLLNFAPNADGKLFFEPQKDTVFYSGDVENSNYRYTLVVCLHHMNVQAQAEIQLAEALVRIQARVTKMDGETVVGIGGDRIGSEFIIGNDEIE